MVIKNRASKKDTQYNGQKTSERLQWSTKHYTQTK